MMFSRKLASILIMAFGIYIGIHAIFVPRVNIITKQQVVQRDNISYGKKVEVFKNDVFCYAQVDKLGVVNVGCGKNENDSNAKANSLQKSHVAADYNINKIHSIMNAYFIVCDIMNKIKLGLDFSQDIESIRKIAIDISSIKSIISSLAVTKVKSQDDIYRTFTRLRNNLEWIEYKAGFKEKDAQKGMPILFWIKKIARFRNKSHVNKNNCSECSNVEFLDYYLLSQNYHEALIKIDTFNNLDNEVINLKNDIRDIENTINIMQNLDFELKKFLKHIVFTDQ